MNQMANTKIVIVDEFSMMKSDILYRLDLGLREIKNEKRKEFGNCMVILLGDLLQVDRIKITISGSPAQQNLSSPILM